MRQALMHRQEGFKELEVVAAALIAEAHWEMAFRNTEVLQCLPIVLNLSSSPHHLVSFMTDRAQTAVHCR